MIKVKINGEYEQIESGLSIDQLIIHKGLAERKIALELNEEILPARSYGETIIRENDEIEIVHAIGGG